MTTLVNLIYASFALELMSEAELLNVLTKSRDNNARLDITGMLLYRRGSFLQVLEGDKRVVDDLFKVIARDPRHYRITRLQERSVTKREFENWSMGFANLDSVDSATIPGYSSYMTERFNSKRFKEVGFAYTFLRMFKEQIRLV